MTSPVQIIGVMPDKRAKTGDFAEFLFTGRKYPGTSPTGKIYDQKLDPPSFKVPDSLQVGRLSRRTASHGTAAARGRR